MHYQCSEPGCGSTVDTHDAKDADFYGDGWRCQSHVPGMSDTGPPPPPLRESYTPEIGGQGA